MRTHSLLSPSSAHRWTICPGSVALCRDLPSEESDYAAEGTAAHALAESLLTGTPYDVPAEYDTPDFRAHVQTYVDFVKLFGGMLDVEVRVDLSPWLGEGTYGTADAVVWEGGDLYIIDLKFGMGYVDAHRNPQLALYACGYLSMCTEFDTVDRLHLCIVQPRIGSISQWDVTAGELSDFIVTLRKKAVIARTMAELPESEVTCVPNAAACKFCRARGTCRALSDAVSATVSGSEPATLAPEELAEAYGRLGLVKIWQEAVEKTVYARLLHGEPVPGLKLVEGRKGSRKWRSEADALKAIQDAGITADVFEKKLLSPAKMEKLLKDDTITKAQWDALAPEITQENTKPTVTDESDKRPEYRPAELAYPNMETETNG